MTHAIAVSQSSPLVPETRSIPDHEAPGRVRWFDCVTAGAICAAIIVLRILCIHGLRWHSDEPQHLHVVWGWATGRLPYRDVFDNHSPLFAFLFSPLFRLVGERNDIVDVMRWFMLPFLAASLWFVYKLGEQLFSARVGLWAAVIASLFPDWFLMMAQFRTDVLWTTLWLGSLVILATGRFSARRFFYAGLVLGAAFSVTMKTTLMLMTLCVAGLVTLVYCYFADRSRKTNTRWAELLVALGAGLLGLVIIPAAFILFFAVEGILPKMYYCVIQHNIIGSHGIQRMLRRSRGWQTLLIPAVLVVSLSLRSTFRNDPSRAARRLFLLFVIGFFVPILEAVWTSVTPQDYMPIWPLVGGAVGVILLLVFESFSGAHPLVRHAERAFLLVVTGFEIWMILHGGFQHSGDPADSAEISSSFIERANAGGIEAIREARALTNPGDYLMDSKGETIYRQRPYWYVLESFTRKRLIAGNLPDELPDSLIATRTAVTTISNRMMPSSQKFINENYVAVGLLHVLGQIMPGSEGQNFTFEIKIPEHYTLMTRNGQRPAGLLDGQPFTAPRVLEAGTHTFQRTRGTGPVAFLWARAAEKGFSPFYVPAVKAN